MVTAQIAYNHLDPDVKTRCDALIAVPVYESSDINSNFVTAACWADDIKSYTNAWDTQHYINLPISLDGYPTNSVANDPTNVVTAIRQCVATLQDPTATPSNQAVALRFLIHFVGDIHCPMHCSDGVTTNYPTGDEGGNYFYITGYGGNLHSLWDRGGGYLIPYPYRPLDATDEAALSNKAAAIEADYPYGPGIRTIPDPMDWAVESRGLGQTVAYVGITSNTAPSEAYTNAAQATTEQRMAIGGHRLADLLNSIPHIYTEPGSYAWTCPADVTSVQVECWGGGGAGGSAVKTSTGNALGGGGAGGAYAKTDSVSVIPGTNYTVTVGAGGISSITEGVAMPGGDSSFSYGTTTNCLAKGGAGGLSISNSTGSGRTAAGGAGTTSGSVGNTLFAGGSGHAGIGSPTNCGGGGGGGAGDNGAGGDASSTTNTAGVGGNGLITAGGSGGDGGVSGDFNGSNGSIPGGGGGGARGTTQNIQRTGGTGGAGLVVLTCTARTVLESWLDYYGVPADSADADADGLSNNNEFLAGFNPSSTAAYLHIISVARSGSDMNITYLGANGDTLYGGGPSSRTNVLEYSTGDANGSYTANFLSTGVTNILSGGTGLGIITNMMESGGAINQPARYYRVRVLVP